MNQVTKTFLSIIVALNIPHFAIAGQQAINPANQQSQEAVNAILSTGLAQFQAMTYEQKLKHLGDVSFGRCLIFS